MGCFSVSLLLLLLFLRVLFYSIIMKPAFLLEGCLDQIGGKSVYLSSSLTTRNNKVRTCATVTSPMRTSQQARWERDGALEPNLDLHIISDIKPKPKPSPGHIWRYLRINHKWQTMAFSVPSSYMYFEGACSSLEGKGKVRACFLAEISVTLTSCPLENSSRVRYSPLKRVPPITSTRFLSVVAMFMLPRRALILAGDSAKLDTPVGANAPTSVTTDNATLNIVVSLACEK